MTIVRTDHLTKDFSTGFWRPRPHRALSELSLEVPAGGVFGLLGPNGAGKSTTLKLLTNLLRPTSGRAELFGRPAGDLSARQRLGFLPENPTFYDHLSAEELLTYFAGLFGYRGADRRRRAEAVLDRVGLGADRRRPIRQYSKGMVQRVGLAQALVNDPELIILDEPMSGLDPIGRREVRDLIFTLREEQRTVLFSSHILSDAEALCHRVAILAKGRLVVSDAVDSLTTRHNKGWDVVATELNPLTADRIAKEFSTHRTVAAGRLTFQVAPGARPEPIIAAIAAGGGQLVAVTPNKTTLEDVFLGALGQPALDQADASDGEGPRSSNGPLTRVAS